MRFVLIDKLLECQPGVRAVASTTFPSSHDVFADHFPGRPIVPGVLLIEAMSQTAGWAIAAGAGFERWPLLVMVEHAKFRRLVGPDEEVRLTAQVQSAGEERFIAAAEAARGTERVASAKLLFQLFHFQLSTEDADRFSRWARDTFSAISL